MLFHVVEAQYRHLGSSTMGTLSQNSYKIYEEKEQSCYTYLHDVQVLTNN